MVRPRFPASLPGVVILLFAGWTVFELVEPKNSFAIQLYNHYACVAHATSLRGLYDRLQVEYPPLSIGLFVATRTVAETFAPATSGRPQVGHYATIADVCRFGRAFGVLGCAVQVLVFAGLFRIGRRMYPEEPPAEFAGRLSVYLAGSLLMTDLVHERLDAMLAAMVFLSVVLLGKNRWVASYAVLAAAIAFKLVPAALGPVWLFASVPADRRQKGRAARGTGPLASALALRGAVLTAFMAAWLFPFYLIGGPRSFAFLAFHRARGIQCESSYGSLLLLLRSCGYPVVARLRFGCWEFVSPLSSLMGVASTLTLGAGLLAAAIVGFVTLRPGPAGDRPGRTAPDLRQLSTLTSLTLMVFAGLGKVFSPQYALWVIPLVPLLPLQGWARHGFFGLFLFACLLTRLAHPALQPILNGRDSVLPVMILTVRALLWLALIVWQVRLSFQPVRAPETAATVGRYLRRAGVHPNHFGVPHPLFLCRHTPSPTTLPTANPSSRSAATAAQPISDS